MENQVKPVNAEKRLEPKKLIYRDGGFWLQSAATEKKLSPGEVRLYQKLADERATRIIDRAFVKQYSFKTELPRFLDPHQIDGVRWIMTRSRSYLAHAPGAGKTLEAITAAFLTPGIGQAVFVCPPSLAVNWAREVRHWTKRLTQVYGILTGHSDCRIVSSSPLNREQERQTKFLILPDTLLTRDGIQKSLAQTSILFLAVDEASRFKEPSAARTVALFGGRLPDGTSYPGLIYKPRHVVLLDGSPLLNRPAELWAPTYAMCPEAIDFMSYEDFGHRYCNPTFTDYGRVTFRGESNTEELHQKLTKSFMHVVPESALNHPERQRSILFMNHDPRSALQRAFEKKTLSQISLSELTEENAPGELASYRRELGLLKVKWVSEYVKEKLKSAPKSSILLFAWHREVILKLSLYLNAFVPSVVLGGVPMDKREEEFARFQNGQTRLLIGNIQAMGRGNNLQRADRIVFGEYSWTDELNKQCEKRASRKGRDVSLPVRCDYIAIPGSLDEIILRSNLRKADTVKKVIG